MVGAIAVTPADAREQLARHLLVDGFDLVLDTHRSRGSWLVDARDGSRWLDLFTFFASSPLGMNPPQLTGDPAFLAELTEVAVNKPSNSDVATTHLAAFVTTFHRVLGVPELPHTFLIDGGALAVENALKAAFDARQRGNAAAGRDGTRGTQVLHLTGAFHGRSGYTMSLTNTDPRKVAGFPRFPWPRIDAPGVRFPVADHLTAIEAAEERALDQARAAFATHGDDLACFIAEPIQCEGGDVHLRAEFLRAVQTLCREHGALFVLDEVQTGAGVTGTAWCHQQLGLEPDLVAFGKKTQVCGVLGGRGIDDVAPNVFTESGRINSTWGGNLVDAVRARRLLEVIEAEDLIGHARRAGEHLRSGLDALAARHPDRVDPVRGRGLLCAFDLPTSRDRDALLHELHTRERLLVLGAGDRTVRFRPHLAVPLTDLDEALDRLDRALSRLR